MIQNNLNLKEKITPLSIKRIIVMVSLLLLAGGLRGWPLGQLGPIAPWLTFYPAIMLIALYGGLLTGSLATFITCYLVHSLWFITSNVPYVKNDADHLGMYVFVFNGLLMSVVAEAVREANRRAKKSRDEANRANAAKGYFLANMSHELRTPLNSILGYSELLYTDTPISNEQREYLKTINRSGEHLLSLINSVLEISKIDANRLETSMSTINLHGLIEEIKKMFSIKINEKGLKFIINNIDILPAFIISDETKIKAILINLIGNAVKFTETGSITLSFSRSDLSPTKSVLSITIEDTGKGIAHDERQLLFSQFQQTSSGKDSKSGTGLGLVISKEYAKLLSGDIQFESSIGIGTTFTITIEVDLVNEPSTLNVTTERRIVGIASKDRIPRVLVADDTDESRTILIRLLNKIGLEIREALNGQEAVDIFKRWHPDFIWMDIRMPVMDGLEATKFIRSIDKSKETKIVALSAHILGQDKLDVLNAGCDEYLAKPFKQKDIYDVMQRQLNLIYSYEDDLSEILNEGFLDFSSLTPETILKIQKAAQLTDAQTLKEISDEISMNSSPSSKYLLKCAKQYEFKQILSSIDKYLKKELT